MYISIKLFQSLKLTWMISVLQLALNSRIGIGLRLCLFGSPSVFSLISSFSASSLSTSSLVCTLLDCYLSCPFLLMLNKGNFTQTFYVMSIYKCIFHWRLIFKKWHVPTSSSCLRFEDCFSLHSSDPGACAFGEDVLHRGWGEIETRLCLLKDINPLCSQLCSLKSEVTKSFCAWFWLFLFPFTHIAWRHRVCWETLLSLPICAEVLGRYLNTPMLKKFPDFSKATYSFLSPHLSKLENFNENS